MRPTGPPSRVGQGMPSSQAARAAALDRTATVLVHGVPKLYAYSPLVGRMIAPMIQRNGRKMPK
jgi:hypothetical protein